MYESLEGEVKKMFKRTDEPSLYTAEKEIKGQNLNDYFSEMLDFVDVTINSNIDSFFILGKGGIGKSYNIIRRLKELGIKYKYYQGNITPLELYKLLYKNKNRVIFFDDTHSLIRNERSMSLLLQALWSVDGEEITWLSSTKLLEKEDIPHSFKFKGKIIFSLNEIPNNESLKVLMSRVFFYHLTFTYEELLNMMYKIASSDGNGLKSKERIRIVDFIKRETDKSTKGFNLRLQKKVEELYKNSSNWKDRARIIMEKSERKRKFLKIIEKDKSESEKIEEFKKTFGKSRATFYRYKKELNRNI